jgi:hypothetical protein
MDLRSLGHIVEGIVERDAITGHACIRTEDSEGNAVTVDVQTLLQSYQGQEVRLTLASFDNLTTLENLVLNTNHAV